MTFNEKFLIETSSLPDLQNPKLVCGLPGSGFVGKIAVDYIIDKLHAKQFADIYSSSFPPQVTIQPDGTVDLIKNSLYYCKTGYHDLVLLTGDAQPVSPKSEYLLAEEIINVCKKLHIDIIYALAAYITGTFSKTPKVYGTSTSIDLIQQFSKYEIQTMDRGSITGMNGIIIGVAKKLNMKGICLLGETSGYVIDAKASKAVLQVLSQMLEIKLDMTELDKKVEDTEKIIKSIESQASREGYGQTAMPQPSNKNLEYIS